MKKRNNIKELLGPQYLQIMQTQAVGEIAEAMADPTNTENLRRAMLTSMDTSLLAPPPQAGQRMRVCSPGLRPASVSLIVSLVALTSSCSRLAPPLSPPR